MTAHEHVTLRNVEASDLGVFFAHQLDPEAIRLAAFVADDPTNRAVFDVQWEKILSSPEITTRTLLVSGQVAGHISCYPHGGAWEVTYWLGREFWGRGVATEALQQMLHLIHERPITARAATDNVASVRVLQKCGFKIVGRNKDFANGRGEVTEEYLLRLTGCPCPG